MWTSSSSLPLSLTHSLTHSRLTTRLAWLFYSIHPTALFWNLTPSLQSNLKSPPSLSLLLYKISRKKWYFLYVKVAMNHWRRIRWTNMPWSAMAAGLSPVWTAVSLSQEMIMLHIPVVYQKLRNMKVLCIKERWVSKRVREWWSEYILIFYMLICFIGVNYLEREDECSR